MLLADAFITSFLNDTAKFEINNIKIPKFLLKTTECQLDFVMGLGSSSGWLKFTKAPEWVHGSDRNHR